MYVCMYGQFLQDWDLLLMDMWGKFVGRSVIYIHTYIHHHLNAPLDLCMYGVYVCMDVCTYDIYVMHVCTYVCMYVRTYVCMYVGMINNEYGVLTTYVPRMEEIGQNANERWEVGHTYLHTYLRTYIPT